MKNYILSLLFIFVSFSTFAQFAETIRSGRPGQSIGAYTVGNKVLQLQTGLNINKITFDDYDDLKNTILTETTVLRYGIIEKLEVSGVVQWRDYKNHFGENFSGISSTQVGLRYNIAVAKGNRPAIGLQGRLLLPLTSDVFFRETLGAKVVLAAGNSITSWLSYITNVSVTKPAKNNPLQFNYSAAFSFSLGKNLGAFVEAYGRLNNDFNNNVNIDFDTGLSYFINDKIKLDASIGSQNEGIVKDWFVDFGLSFRIVGERSR